MLGDYIRCQEKAPGAPTTGRDTPCYEQLSQHWHTAFRPLEQPEADTVCTASLREKLWISGFRATKPHRL